MSIIKAVIVDDEPDSITLLQLMLQQNCPQVRCIGTYTDSMQALAEIPDMAPDLLFVDVEMPGLNGFELLEKLMPLSFRVIFITAYSQYALKAFRYSALDYLVKPIAAGYLQDAVGRAGQQYHPVAGQLSILQQYRKGDVPINKIAVASSQGVLFIELSDIIYAESNNNYTKLHLVNGGCHVVSKTLKDVQELLEETHFMRVHRQYIVNLHRVKRLDRNDGVLTMENNAELPVARNQKERLLNRYGML